MYEIKIFIISLLKKILLKKRVLGLQNDFLKLAADDELGRKLQDFRSIIKMAINKPITRF